MNSGKGGGVSSVKKNKDNEQEYKSEDYAKKDFLKDLKKVCRPVKKRGDKRKPSSGKT